MPFPLPDEATVAERYPPSLKLKLVEVVHRHGQRSPAHPFFANIQAPGLWNRCHLTPFLHALYVVGGDLQESQHTVTPPLERPPHFNRVLLNPADHDIEKMQAVSQLKTAVRTGDCFQGQLTDKGKETMREAGINLRKLYVEKLGLLEGTMGQDYHKRVYLRSTDYARTIESLQYLLDGLHPPPARVDEADANLTIHVRSMKNETMYPHPNCSYLNAVSKQFRVSVQASLKKETEMLLRRLSHLGTDIDKPHLLQIHALYDIFACMQGHGLPLPKGVAQRDMDELESITMRQWFGAGENSEHVASLAIGRLLSDLKTRIEKTVRNRDPVKLAIYSAHDTTIGPLLTAFKVSDGRYPPFAAMVNFELFEEASHKRSVWSRLVGINPPPHYVRMLYNGQPLRIPACAPVGKHREGDDSLCTLDAFMEHVDRMIPKDYEKSCKTEKFVKEEYLTPLRVSSE
ncbi:uncharacterized protein SPPG_00894 [Spizellomyces punctatus DAOM BR117]|uniref:Acid phosphatase n=1 Tax=Spizellomyces punctatus (strain DAOM BR117) TaxID=645134 RepID=A0A0L0HQR3_SPIPD|nr:uncharacterized protein SPPG_00894 [Spizellomyces punctatus DAOM BR117]KND03408.1 hypothetical protein SPPG_00894 [Spizellomyces punctatus DAOM BR117]|eukprot:XP_016611447.1 hypothetical protein SPPG_00894 [Spizellomyces punctatus DAOM BR117]